MNSLSDSEVLQIREIIDRDYMVEGDLRREKSMNIKRLDGPWLLSWSCDIVVVCRLGDNVPIPMPEPEKVLHRAIAGKKK